MGGIFPYKYTVFDWDLDGWNQVFFSYPKKRVWELPSKNKGQFLDCLVTKIFIESVKGRNSSDLSFLTSVKFPIGIFIAGIKTVVAQIGAWISSRTQIQIVSLVFSDIEEIISETENMFS